MEEEEEEEEVSYGSERFNNLQNTQSTTMKDKNGQTLVKFEKGKFFDNSGKEITKQQAEQLLKKAHEYKQLATLHRDFT